MKYSKLIQMLKKAKEDVDIIYKKDADIEIYIDNYGVYAEIMSIEQTGDTTIKIKLKAEEI